MPDVPAIASISYVSDGLMTVRSTPCGGQVVVVSRPFSIPIAPVTFWEEWGMIIICLSVLVYILGCAASAYAAGKRRDVFDEAATILFIILWPLGWVVYGVYAAFCLGVAESKSGYHITLGEK